MCGLEGGCGVCECDEHEIPIPWKVEQSDKVHSVSSSNFASRWDDNNEDVTWIVNDGPESQMSYVNLQDNPEGNTGYSEDAAKVWLAIYNENCFQKEEENTCIEKRTFYRLFSGLHSSITTHVAMYHHKDANGQWETEPKMYYYRVGKFPDRVHNMFFAYLFLLRAVHKASPVLESINYDTGNPEEDRHTKEEMLELLKGETLCEPTFNEGTLFASMRHEYGDTTVERTKASDPLGSELMRQFKGKFRNISVIMDCVGCEKCKIWGKLEVLGLGTAMKILFDDDYELHRNEIIALINTLRQFSDGIAGGQKMMEQMKKILAAESAAKAQQQQPSAPAATSKPADQPPPATQASSEAPSPNNTTHSLVQMYFEQPQKLALALVVVLPFLVMKCLRVFYKPKKSPGAPAKPKPIATLKPKAE